jgi:hypothetical protein
VDHSGEASPLFEVLWCRRIPLDRGDWKVGGATSKLEVTVAGFEVGGFVEGGVVVFEPLGDPFHEEGFVDLWGAEEAMGFGGVVEPGGVGFVAGDGDIFTEAVGEPVGGFAGAEDVGAGDVEDEGGGRGSDVGEALDDVGEGVALPDAIEVSHGGVDGFIGENFPGDIDEDAVLEIDGVIEADDGEGSAGGLALGQEGIFAVEAGLGVFADGRGGIGFVGASGIGGDEGVDAAGGEGDDGCGLKSFCDEGGQVFVEVLEGIGIAGGAELLSGEEEDGGGSGEGLDLIGIGEVAGAGFDVVCGEGFPDGGIGEAGRGKDAVIFSEGIEGSFEHEGEVAAHFSAGTEHEEIAVDAVEGFEDAG